MGRKRLHRNRGSRRARRGLAVERSGRLRGAVDLDLNFSPSTNLLPIRRLNLEIGQEAAVPAAWMRFPSFVFEPLEQTYKRIDATTYRYESAGGRFRVDLTVDYAGLVTFYPGLAISEPGE